MQGLLLTAILLISLFNTALAAQCKTTNDHRNYTCTGFRFREFVVSRSTKLMFLRTWIYDCRETQIPEEVLKFPNLENLTISCDIEQIHENAFKNLNHLQELDLGNNTIATLPDNMFQGLGELQSLNLSNNNFDHLTKTMFNGLNNLKQLFLSNNIISNLDAKALNKMRNLEKINLKNNHISFIPINFFNKVTQLRYINMAYNNIEDLGAIFAQSYNLSKLNLSHNLIKELPARIFQTTQLTILDLSHNWLTVLYEDSLKLDTLEELYVHNNQLSLFEVKGLVPNRLPLNVLDVQNNRLVFLEDDFIKNVNSPLTIKVGGNPWECECIMKIEMTRADIKLLTNPDLPLCVSGNSNECSVDRNNLTFYYNVFKEQLDD